MADFKAGDHVFADFGDARKVLAHVVSGPKTNDDGETKFRVQAPDGSSALLAHREPEDRDAAGSGLTFWRL